MKTAFVRTVALAVLVALAPSAGAESLPLLRVFLTDGTTLTSYGEYARVDGRIVFSMPFGEVAGSPRLQVVSLPAASVDWARTNDYRDAARARRYAASRGESDFAALSGEVASVLNEVALAENDTRRVALIESARSRLLAWPAEHYNYRLKDVREIVQLLDEALSELRASTGTQSFDLNLVAMAEPAAALAIQPDPGPAETVAEALTLADISDDPADRERVLTETLAYLNREADRLDPVAVRNAREFAERRLLEERRADIAYRKLREELVARADAAAAAADVRAAEKVLASLDTRDERLGRRRPAAVRALYAALRSRLNAARQLRLARDQWRLRSKVFKSYSRVITRPRSVLEDLRTALEAVKQLSGPDIEAIGELTRRADYASRLLHRVVPPSDLAPIHALFVSASQMAAQALQTRLRAARSGDMPTAWTASSAASGALLLMARAEDELERYLAPPEKP